jgi:hypothetical protein
VQLVVQLLWVSELPLRLVKRQVERLKHLLSLSGLPPDPIAMEIQ